MTVVAIFSSYFKKVCRDRVLSPLNLISCCNFFLILRHSLLVLSMFFFTTQCLCRNKTFLYSTYLCVATQFVMSRQDLSSLCWNLCRDIEKVCCDLFYQFLAYLCVATLRFLSRHRNISSSLSMSPHWIFLLRPGQFTKQASHVVTLFISRN